MQSQSSGAQPMQAHPASVPPGHQSAASPVSAPPHYQQHMGGQFPPPQNMLRQGSGGMSMGAPGFPPQSPQGSYGGHARSSSQGFHQMHSPVHHLRNQMQMQHPSMQGAPQHSQHMGMQSRGSANMASGGMSSDSRQQYIPTGLNGNWQSDKDMPHRREMIQHIVKMLKKDENGSPEWLSKLPQMAKQLEVSLYRNAQSFNAYMDMTTLKHRLQMIAMEVSRKAKAQGSDAQYSHSGNQDDRRTISHSNGSASPYAAAASSLSRRTPSSTPTERPAKVVKMDEINPMASGGNPDVARQSAAYSSSREAMPVQNSFPGNRNDPGWKERIRHKQQRLLLLHHSAKCPHEAGRCTTTPHCADMKRLWRHMEGCKDNNCRVSHCFSSRAILSHYRKCKDPYCPACGPVRETVRKSHSKQSSSSQGGTPRNSSGPMMTAMLTQSYPEPSSSQRNSMVSSPDHMPGGPAGSFSAASSATSRQQSGRSSMPPPANQAATMQYSSAPYRSSSAGTPTSSSQPSPGYKQPSPHPSNGSSSSRRNDSEWQKVRHKQQRLLLLRHASKCQYKAGECPVTPHCASMKKLWEHIAHCRNQQCTVPHCMSSRYVLSHYRRCKDPRCPACGPVRSTIRQSNDKDKTRSLQGSRHPDPEQQLLVSMTADMAPPDAYSYEPQTKRRKSDQVSSEGSSMSTPVYPDLSAMSAARREAIQSSKKSKAAGEKAATETEDHSLINSFTVEEIETHLASLDRTMQLPPVKLKTKCLEVLKGLQNHQHGWVFNNPVDPIELGLPDYFDVIKKPMDLGTIAKKLENGLVHSLDDFYADVCLTFDNAMLYNEDGSVVHDMAKELKLKFVSDYSNLLVQLEAEDQERRRNDRACTLCGCEKLLFEPPIYFCNGLNCQTKRIRRNSHFYIGGNNQYFWCNQCYNEIDDGSPIELADMSISKAELKKKKNDEVHEESWVQCDDCQCWIHQICGLFNSRQNKEHHSKYFCPKCLLKRQKQGRFKPTAKPPSAEDLPRTKLTEFLESHVQAKVDEKMARMAADKVEAERIPLAEAEKAVRCNGGPITIRQLTSTDRKLEVRERMKRRYAFKNYPDEFPFRCKLIVVFQKLDGVDVILFALYVYEHGADNPAPNTRTVYISYLDSVYYMRPRKLRTLIYHEILIRYLDYARLRGFATAHIWACPPLKGDDYIFYAKPEDQKTPRDARLRQWYLDMLTECQRRNIVGKVTNMYDLYFANESLDATVVPYLEGDYFPGEAELVIKDIEDGKGGAGGKKKKKSQNKSKNNKKGTRSGGIDEAALAASGIMESAPKALQEGGRDEVMVKMGETIEPMKESFIVAFLNWSGAKEEDMVVPEEIVRYRQEQAAKDKESKGEAGEQAANEKERKLDAKPNQPSSTSEEQSRKRDSGGNMKQDSPKAAVPKDGNGGEIKVIDDDKEDMDCEFFNNRQAFLNLCRGNHYQYDELRRAKHTSMMVLWHLHNRDAPKFVQQCASCFREILSGTRYHCETCPDYDLCEDCYKNPSANRGACRHNLRQMSVESDNNQDMAGGRGLSEEERRERQRNIQLHIQLIEHASRCNSSQCTSSNCAKMKSYLQHGRICKVKASGGCKICKRIWTLLRIHAQKCKDPRCKIPQCMAIRERIRQLAKQQQAMDDRRRAEMNRHFSQARTAH